MAGAGAGVYGMVRVRRVQQALTRGGMSDRWHALTLGARLLRDEVAQGQAEAETHLRERYGLMPHGRPQLVATGVATHAPETSQRRRQEGEGED
jgi:hypothetical protein